MHSRTPTLDRYVRAAEATAGRTGRAAASRAQIAFAVSLAYGARVPDAQRINTLAALKRGVSGPHCGVLIRGLKPFRQDGGGNAAPAPETHAPPASKPTDLAATALAEELPPESMLSDDEMELVSAYGSSEDNDHHHPFR